MVVGHAQLLPDLDGLVVVEIHGEVQALGRQAQHLVENSYAHAHISSLKYSPKLKLPNISKKLW